MTKRKSAFKEPTEGKTIKKSLKKLSKKDKT